MPLTVDGPRGRETRTVRFFDFDHPEGGLNEFVVTTQFRVRRSNERGGPERTTNVWSSPDLVLFVNGIPLVVMEAKSPSLMDVWKTQAVRQLQRYQEAQAGVARCRRPGAVPLQPVVRGALRGRGGLCRPWRALETAYFQWKSVAPYTEDQVRQRFGVEPQGQAQLIVGLLAPATLLDVLRGLRGLRAGAGGGW